MIASPWRKKSPPIPFIANQVVSPSYLSLDWALQYYDLIPEYVPNPTSITTDRGIRIAALDTLFIYHHIKPSYFNGFQQINLENHPVNIAFPEKALFDKIHISLHNKPFSLEWFDSLRLQNLEKFDINHFGSYFHELKDRKMKNLMNEAVEYLKERKREMQ